MKIRAVLYYLMLLLLLLPLGNYAFKFAKSKGLYGWQPTIEKPYFSSKNYFSGDFQEGYEPWYKAKTGFANDFVRLRNQIYYSCFNISLNPKIIVGKQGYIYEENYITQAVLGQDEVSMQKIMDKAHKIKLLQDTLTRQGKHLLVVFAPGKGSYYPEYIPDFYVKQPRKTTNYSATLEVFRDSCVNFIDCK